MKPKSKKLIWHTELRRVDDLLPYDRNPRVISDKQMDDMKRSLKKFNLAELPAVNADGKIAAGHQRIKALQLLGRGQEMIEVRVPNRQLTEAEFKAYLLTSNRSGGDWNWDALASDFNIDSLLTAGFNADDLTHIFDDSLAVEDDHFDEDVELAKIKKTDIKPGDYFALGRHRLLCADALDPATAKKLMSGAQADMVNDDMPYNIGLSYDRGVGNKSRYGGKTNDRKTDANYEAFVKTVMQNALAVTKPDAHVFFWCD